MLTRFSKKGISEVKAAIEYVNVPQNRILAESNLKLLSFNVLANKFEIIYHTLKTPKITVDVTSYLKASNKDVILDKATLESLIVSQLDKNLIVKNIYISELEIKLDKIDTKKVPIVLKTLIALKNGFDIVGVPKIIPDSIVLSGSKKVLDSISEIATVLFQRDEIDSSLSVTIPLKPLLSKDVKVEETFIVLKLQVEEFAQKNITVPVKLINAPINETIKIIPSTVQVRFIVSLSLFNEILANDFVVVCDYSERNVEENFMIPKIKDFPKGIKNMELRTHKIDFLIFK